MELRKVYKTDYLICSDQKNLDWPVELRSRKVETTDLGEVLIKYRFGEYGLSTSDIHWDLPSFAGIHVSIIPTTQRMWFIICIVQSQGVLDLSYDLLDGRYYIAIIFVSFVPEKF